MLQLLMMIMMMMQGVDDCDDDDNNDDVDDDGQPCSAVSSKSDGSEFDPGPILTWRLIMK